MDSGRHQPFSILQSRVVQIFISLIYSYNYIYSYIKTIRNNHVVHKQCLYRLIISDIKKICGALQTKIYGYLDDIRLVDCPPCHVLSNWTLLSRSLELHKFFYIWQLISVSLIFPQLYNIINPFKVFPAAPPPGAAADAENFNYFDQINLLPAEKSKTWHLSEEFFQNIKI